jgi:hypothetical protein
MVFALDFPVSRYWIHSAWAGKESFLKVANLYRQIWNLKIAIIVALLFAIPCF